MLNFEVDPLKGSFQKLLCHLNLLHSKRNLHDFHVRCSALSLNIRGIIAAVLCSTVSLSAQELPNEHNSVDFSLSDAHVLKLNELCRDYLDTGVAGMSVLIARDGDICFEGHYSRDRSKLNADTIYLIGSNTKQFTATAILLLKEEGLLSLDDPLSQYIDDFPRGDEINIHHLLTHTSGIGRGPSPQNTRLATDENCGILEVIETFKRSALTFDPGEDWSYSNAAYILLGYIIESVSGTSYESFIHNRILLPLKMERSGVYDRDIEYENFAKGYAYDDGTLVSPVEISPSIAGAAGAMYSTLMDLYHWNEALFSGVVVSEDSMNEAFQPVKYGPRGMQERNYGFGWSIGENDESRFVEHGGSYPGYFSFMRRFIDRKISIIVLSNTCPTQNRREFMKFNRNLSNAFFHEQ